MFKQYRVYINPIEGSRHKEEVFMSYDNAMEYVNFYKDNQVFMENIKNIFITEEGYDKNNGKMLLEEDIYCYKNEEWYKSNRYIIE